MRVGIMTFWGQINYGQNLQLFALSQFLKDAGHRPFLIRYFPADFAANPFPPLHAKDDDKKQVSAAQLAAIWVHVQNDLYARGIHAFIDRYLDVSENIYGYASELIKNPPQADAYIVGSDQVWNFWGRPLEAVRDNELKAFFLDFGDRGAKRVAYAASFGNQKLDGGYQEAFSDLLFHFDYVSVREKAGVDLCQQCGVAETDWVPDPTFLLPAGRYLELLKADRCFTHPEKPYIFVYMVNPNEEHIRKIADLARQRHCELKIVGGNLGQTLAIPGVTLSATIPEFIHLVANAEYIFTDSFHGTAFSLIFNRQFANLPSPYSGKEDTRFQSIFERCGITDRTVGEDFSLPSDVDYDLVGKKLIEIQKQYDDEWLNEKLLQSECKEEESAAAKVSVVIPVYNVEEYLRRCLDSVCGQTLKEIEIICINDCSPDRSIDILREYEAKDSRVKVIDFPKNQGVAEARNAGIDAATGEFIGFVDPDDAVDPAFFETLYNKAKETGADIAKGARKHVGFDGSEVLCRMNERIRTNKGNFSASFWSAIYRGSMIRKNYIRFPAGIPIGEDLVFQARCVLEAKKFVTSDFVFYHYFMREGSAVAESNAGTFMGSRQINSVRSAFNLIIEYANKAFDAGTTDDLTYDLIFYNNLCFSVMIIMLTENVREKYNGAELLLRFYRLCKRKEQLDQRLEEEQRSFYSLIKEGDPKKLTLFFVENYTLEDILRANDVHSAAYFTR